MKWDDRCKGRSGFLLQARLQHGNPIDCCRGTAFIRWWRLGILSLAPLDRIPQVALTRTRRLIRDELSAHRAYKAGNVSEMGSVRIDWQLALNEHNVVDAAHGRIRALFLKAAVFRVIPHDPAEITTKLRDTAKCRCKSERAAPNSLFANPINSNPEEDATASYPRVYDQRLLQL
jgi:hypothetical protein